MNRAHHAMVDGVSSVDILTLLLDPDPEGFTPEPPADGWRPRPEPSNWQLIRPMLWNFRPAVAVGADQDARGLANAPPPVDRACSS